MLILTLSILSPPCEVAIGRNDISEVIIRDNDGRTGICDHVVLFIY